MLHEGSGVGLFSALLPPPEQGPESLIGVQSTCWKHVAVYTSEAVGVSCAFAWKLISKNHKIFIQK